MRKHLIISVHGIFTLAPWQRRLREMVLQAEPGATICECTYGPRSAAILLRIRRGKAAKWLADVLLREFGREQWDRIDIVAHSFGTFLVATAMHLLAADKSRDPLPRIRTLILAGSVLPSTYPWHLLFPSFIDRIVNDCGIRDHILWVPELCSRKLGFGGRVGFKGLTGHGVHNRYFLFGHSGFFAPSQSAGAADFMQQWWVPLLTQDMERVPEHDARSQRRFPTLVAWLEQQVSLLRLLVLVICLAIVTIPLSLHVHRLKKLNEQLLAESWALQSLQKTDTAPIEAKRLAIASARLRRTPQTEHALLKALAASAKPIATLSTIDGIILRFAMEGSGQKLAAAGLDDQGKLFIRLYVRETMTPRPTTLLRLPDQDCSQRRQPQALSFSHTGRYLALEAFHGSCVLDLRTLRWTDLPGVGHVTFSADDTLFYASRSITNLVQNEERVPLLSVFHAAGRGEVSGIVESGWLRDIAIAGHTGAVVVDAIGRAWMVPDNHSPAVRFGSFGRDNPAAVVAASKEGRLVAIGTEGGDIWVAAADSAREAWRTSLKSPPSKLRFSSDGRYLAGMMSDGTARVWASRDGAQLAAFEGGGYPLDVRFLGNDGDRLLTVNRTAGIKVWSVPAQTLLARVPVRVASDAYALDDEGSAVVALEENGTATLWNTAWNASEQKLHLQEGISAFLVRDNGRFVAALGLRGRLRLWDTLNGTVLLDVPPLARNPGAWRSTLALAENGSALAAIDGMGTVRVWRVGKGRVFELQLPRLFADRVIPGHSPELITRSLPVGTDERLLGTCEAHVPMTLRRSTPKLAAEAKVAMRRCELFEPEKTWLDGLMSTDPWAVHAPLALSNDGQQIALPFLDEVLVFNVESRQLIARFAQGYEARTRELAIPGAYFGAALVSWISFSDDGRRLLAATKAAPVSGSGGNVIRSWSLEGRAERTVALDSEDVDLGLFPQVRSVIAVSNGGLRLELWDMDTLSKKESLLIGRIIDSVSVPTWQPASLLVLSHEAFPQLPRQFRTPYVHADVFDVTKLRRRAHVTVPLPAEMTTLSPDGKGLVVESGSGGVRILDLGTGAVLTELALGAKPKALWFRSDGALFYTAGGRLTYANALSGESYIGSLVWEADELVRRLCSTLRPVDSEFASLSSQTTKPIACER